jgi:hypothetical protein
MCAFVYVHIENTLVRGGVERLRRGLLVCVCICTYREHISKGRRREIAKRFACVRLYMYI